MTEQPCAMKLAAGPVEAVADDVADAVGDFGAAEPVGFAPDEVDEADEAVGLDDPPSPLNR